MDLGIAGKNALVTGGSRGLGRQCAISLASEGVNVAICGRTESTIAGTVADLEALGVRALGVVADVTQLDDMARLHRECVEGLGPIDILVNNAGGSMGCDRPGGNSAGQLSRGLRLQPVQRVRTGEAGSAAYEGAAVGPNNQHRFDMGARTWRKYRLYVRQGRSHRGDQARRAVAGSGRRYCELYRAGFQYLTPEAVGNDSRESSLRRQCRTS